MSAIVGWLNSNSQLLDIDLPKSIGDNGSDLCGWCLDSTGVEHLAVNIKPLSQ